MGRYGSSKDGRTRNWATVIYDDSAIDLIKSMHICCFISPWHDKDINATGETKKPHRHVLMNFEGVKSESQIRDLISEFGGVGCEYVMSNRAYARYLCHLDNPEKAQYNINDVLCVGGLNYIDLINSSADVYDTLKDMINYLLDNNITDMFEFIVFCRDNRDDWFDCMYRFHHLSDVRHTIKANLYHNNK